MKLRLNYVSTNNTFFSCLDKIDCKWSDWEYGQCSKTCGGGTRTNYRKELVHQSNGGKACSGSTWMTEDCNKQSCPPGD